MDFLYSIFAFLIALGILVTFHEFGHYWVAKRLGVKVLRFSVGFGKSLFSVRRGPDQTEFSVAAIPLGGYVRMLGENDDEIPAGEEHRAFSNQPLLSRSLIVAAGPVFNFILAILLYWITYMYGIPDIRPTIDHVGANSLAAESGLRAGDTLLSVDGQPVQGWEQNRLYLFDKALEHDTVHMLVSGSDGDKRQVALDFGKLKGVPDTGFLEDQVGMQAWRPNIPPVIGTVLPDSPAARAGLKPGETIIAIDNSPVSNWHDLVGLIEPRDGTSIQVTVREPEGGEKVYTLTPESAMVEGRRTGRIGIAPRPIAFPPERKITVRMGPVAAAGESVKQVWMMSALTLKMLGKMLTLEVSPKQISGPITIAQYAGQSAQIGLDRFLLFLALVSISLGVLNLLPIPILDGGHLLFYAIEAVKGGPLPEKAMVWSQQLGILVLMGLMGLAFYNDITRILH